MSDAIERAIREFDEFIGAWIGPAAQRHVFAPGNPHYDRVRRAIEAAAVAEDDSNRVGWAVFKREHDRDYDRERPSGFVHTMISAVFENPAQVDNACRGQRKRYPRSDVRHLRDTGGHVMDRWTCYRDNRGCWHWTDRDPVEVREMADVIDLSERRHSKPSNAD